MSEKTWIYIIQDHDTGFYKIGKSKYPKTRLHQLIKQDTKLPTPNRFILLDAWYADESVEKDLHKHFKRFHIRGEWFALEPHHLCTISNLFYYNQPLLQEVPAVINYCGQPNRKDEDILLRNQAAIEYASEIDFIQEGLEMFI